MLLTGLNLFAAFPLWNDCLFDCPLTIYAGSSSKSKETVLLRASVCHIELGRVQPCFALDLIPRCWLASFPSSDVTDGWVVSFGPMASTVSAIPTTFIA